MSPVLTTGELRNAVETAQAYVRNDVSPKGYSDRQREPLSWWSNPNLCKLPERTGGFAERVRARVNPHEGCPKRCLPILRKLTHFGTGTAQPRLQPRVLGNQLIDIPRCGWVNFQPDSTPRR